MDIKDWKKQIKGRKVAVVGIGVSNLPLIRLLVSCGAEVTAHDKRTADQLEEVYGELTDLGVSLVLGEGYLDAIKEGTQVVFKTPGLRPDVPALVRAAENGAEITSEMELFFQVCPCPVIAVTGSDGKTTTTTLIGEMLRKEGYCCHIGGNIGKPLLTEAENMAPTDKVVLELSSFQLFSMKPSPKVAVVTNVTPNHLDWHKDFQEYIDAKKNIMAYQAENSVLVTNLGNEITAAMGREAKGEWRSFSSQGEGTIHLTDGVICYGDQPVLKAEEIRLPGMHNVENYMAAIGAVWDDVSVETIQSVARNFGGVAHRIEFVRELDGVRYYNDSIASSPARTTAGLHAFGEKKVILIAGGYDKKIPFEEFGVTVNDHVKQLILVGATSDKIQQAVTRAENYTDLPIYRCTAFEEAVRTAKEVAGEGDVVILSPACASFDLFKNFEVRGNTFKELVWNL